jgi:dienelactone hydrolase
VQRGVCAVPTVLRRARRVCGQYLQAVPQKRLLSVSLCLVLVACASTQQAAPPSAAPLAPAIPPMPPPAAPGADAGARDAALEAEAHRMVTAAARGDDAGVVADFDDRMKAALPPERVGALWNQLLAGAGPFEGFEGTRFESKGDYRIAFVSLRCARAHMDLKVVFDGAGRVAGLFLKPARAAWSPPPYSRADALAEQDVVVGDAPALPGTLTLPKGAGPFPAVILVHGSGPQDRDESIGGVRVFKDLAWGLASRGVASLRYDKRTLVAPAGVVTEKEEVVDGAREALALLRRTPEVDGRRLFVVGHSQGGALAPRIAAADGHLAGVVVLAGPTRAFGAIVVDQMTYLSMLDPGNSALAAQIEDARRFEKTIEDPTLRPDQEIASPWAGRMKGAYFLEQRAYDPGRTARALACPILLLQGKRDYQVDGRDLDGWRRALAGRAGVTVTEYPALNHLFVSGVGKPGPAEYAETGHVFPSVVEDIAAFVGAAPAVL